MLLSAIGQHGGIRPRVLLVEDHADTRLMYAEYLRPDYETSEAADGLAALESIRDVLPDVIVTDLALPRMDGFELIARLRADKRLRSIPVIALSGYSRAEVAARVKTTGPSAVIQKPCLPETLVEELKKQLKKAASE
jgi:two-component system cell cycle response regulator DivK